MMGLLMEGQKVDTRMVVALLTVALAAPVRAGFPELPFCPLGGPPGWFNRLTDRDHRSPPPYWLRYPLRPSPPSYGYVPPSVLYWPAPPPRPPQR